ncbi:hybrid sensor histidine kinase/response regulator [Clostridium sp. CX1]|nr:hybrid sensor histidine kinase/response regulator [Clostridium sp. CX1]MCT8977001.1 hybrid sensor histidine kinase/response regulator [Clostridium sp. CX1]
MSNDLILIVDDNPSNIQVVATIMAEYGYELGIAMNASEAYSFLGENTPELILLDIDMPEIDGYEVCSTLKKDYRYKDIPIIFLTVKDEKEDIVKAFDLGAVDYVTKPFNRKELVSRVRTHLSLKKAKDELQRKNRELKKAMKIKDEFLLLMTHEFKTPLNVILAALQTIENIYGYQVGEKVKNYLKSIKLNSFRQLRLVNNLLDITKINTEHFKMHKRNVDIIFVSQAIVESVDIYAKQKGVELKFSSEVDYLEMAIDEEKYERILLNLLSNAIKFTPEGKAIYVNISYKNRKATITVRDEGIGIPKEKQELIFERFGQVDSTLSRQAEGTGVGLSLAKSLITAMGGKISVDSEERKGSLFTITLPVTKLRAKDSSRDMSLMQDHRIIQAVQIEFSDIYF